MRAAFTRGVSAFIVWVDRVSASRFEDTNRMFAPPVQFDLRITTEGTPDYSAEQIAKRVRPIFDTKRPTTVFIGRYQPFHDGHKALITEGLRRVGQVCVAVSNTAAPMETTHSVFGTSRQLLRCKACPKLVVDRK